jgi:hypothetical protein
MVYKVPDTICGSRLYHLTDDCFRLVATVVIDQRYATYMRWVPSDKYETISRLQAADLIRSFR